MRLRRSIIGAILAFVTRTDRQVHAKWVGTVVGGWHIDDGRGTGGIVGKCVGGILLIGGPFRGKRAFGEGFVDRLRVAVLNQVKFGLANSRARRYPIPPPRVPRLAKVTNA